MKGMSPEEVTLHSEVSLLSCLDTGVLQKAALSSSVSLLQDAKRPLLIFTGQELLKKGRKLLAMLCELDLLMEQPWQCAKILRVRSSG